MKLRPQVQLRFRDEGQWELCTRAAAGAGVSLNEWILRRLENKNGNDEGAAKGSVGQDHGKDGTDDAVRGRDVSKANDEATVPPDGRGKAVLGVRRRVSGNSSNKRKAGSDGAGAVRNAHVSAQPESGSLDGSAQPDTGRQGVCERPFLGPAHRVGCPCPTCKARRTGRF
jgi:hypothetical protein